MKITFDTVSSTALSAIGHPSHLASITTSLITNTPVRQHVLLPAIGYVRVSTERQSQDGGLDRQTVRLREGARELGYAFTGGIYSDIASARGANSIHSRPDFMQALSEAKRFGLPLIVTGASRLSRDLASFRKLAAAEGVEIVSLDDGGLLDREQVLKGVEKAQANGDAIVRGASRAVQERRVGEKVGVGLPERASTAAQASARVRTKRKLEVIEELADFLQMNPQHLDATHNELVRILNDAELTSGSGRQWTYDALRKKLPQAREEVARRRELDDEINIEPCPDFGTIDVVDDFLGTTDDGADNTRLQVVDDVENNLVNGDVPYHDIHDWGRFGGEIKVGQRNDAVPEHADDVIEQGHPDRWSVCAADDLHESDDGAVATRKIPGLGRFGEISSVHRVRAAKPDRCRGIKMHRQRGRFVTVDDSDFVNVTPTMMKPPARIVTVGRPVPGIRFFARLLLPGSIPRKPPERPPPRLVGPPVQPSL